MRRKRREVATSIQKRWSDRRYHTRVPRVPDARRRHGALKTRVNALTALLRRAGTQKATCKLPERWAPALQRITEEVLRCVRGTRAERRRPKRLTPARIVRRFAGDGHVVDMAFAQAGAGDED